MDQNWDFSLIPSSKLFFSDLIVRRQFESEIASVFPHCSPTILIMKELTAIFISTLKHKNKPNLTADDWFSQ